MRAVTRVPLKQCSSENMATTGVLRNGRCSTQPNDQGKHHVCIDVGADFCATTNQRDWCTEEFPCQNGTCSIERWCVCEWAFAEYVAQKGCDAVKVHCDATNEKVLEHYTSHIGDKKVAKALKCIQTSCSRRQILRDHQVGK